MITLQWAYYLVGAMFAAFAILSALDKANAKRFGNAAFWGLMALSLLGGDMIGDFGNGLLVLGLAGLAGFGFIGRSHPPKNSVTAIADTAIILAYSARKYRENRNPLYSVWKPATSSDSASGRSKGARLVSAIPQTKNRMNPSGCRKTNHQPNSFCFSTISTRLNDPAIISTPMIEKPRATS